MISWSDKQHEQLNKLIEEDHVHLKNIGNELVTLKSETMRLPEDTKVLRVTANKFHKNSLNTVFIFLN